MWKCVCFDTASRNVKSNSGSIWPKNSKVFLEYKSVNIGTSVYE